MIKCKNCSSSKMIPTNGVIMTYPVQDEYKCESCGELCLIERKKKESNRDNNRNNSLFRK